LGKGTQGAADFLSILESISERLELDDLAFAAVVAQQIWHRRNKVEFEGVMGNPTCLLKCAADSLDDYRLTRRVVDPPSNRPISQNSPSWSTTPDGWTKLIGMLLWM
jgi:hypothetical protein